MCNEGVQRRCATKVCNEGVQRRCATKVCNEGVHNEQADLVTWVRNEEINEYPSWRRRVPFQQSLPHCSRTLATLSLPAFACCALLCCSRMLVLMLSLTISYDILSSTILFYICYLFPLLCMCWHLPYLSVSFVVFLSLIFSQ